MKICWSARRALAAYHDRELEQARAQSLEAHIRTCARCQGEIEDLRRVTRLLRALPGPSRPEGYWAHALQDLRGKIQGLPPPARSSLLQELGRLAESPAWALVPVTLFCAALMNTLLNLGLEGEAFTLFSSYLLPFILD